MAEQELRDRVHDQRELEALLGVEYHKNRVGPCPEIPKDPRSWCAVHHRPTSYKEFMSVEEGEEACFWCRGINVVGVVAKTKQTFDEAAAERKSGKTKAKPMQYTSWD